MFHDLVLHVCFSIAHHHMAFARSAATAVLRSSVCTQCRRVASARAFPQPAIRPRPQLAQRTLASNVRWHSAPASNSKVYDFSQVQKLAESPSGGTVLIGMVVLNDPRKHHLMSALRRPRAFRVCSWVHSICYQPSYQVPTRRALPSRGRIRRSLWICQTYGG